MNLLTATGHITDERRREFILLSDVLGLSTLVTVQNNAKSQGCTRATVFDPFFVEGAPKVENGADVSNGTKGRPCWVSGHRGKISAFERLHEAFLSTKSAIRSPPCRILVQAQAA